MNNIESNLIQLAETKNLIKNAIIVKGVEVTSETPFRDYADKIKNIQKGLSSNCVYYGNAREFTVDVYPSVNSIDGFVGTTNIRNRIENANSWECSTIAVYNSLSNGQDNQHPLFGFGYPISNLPADNIGMLAISYYGKILVLFSSNGSSWDIGTIEFSVPNIGSGELIKLTVKYDSTSGYSVIYENLNTGYTQTETLSNTTKVGFLPNHEVYLALANNFQPYPNGAGYEVFDLNNTYIKIDNETIKFVQDKKEDINKNIVNEKLDNIIGEVL